MCCVQTATEEQWRIPAKVPARTPLVQSAVSGDAIWMPQMCCSAVCRQVFWNLSHIQALWSDRFSCMASNRRMNDRRLLRLGLEAWNHSEIIFSVTWWFYVCIHLCYFYHIIPMYCVYIKCRVCMVCHVNKYTNIFLLFIFAIYCQQKGKKTYVTRHVCWHHCYSQNLPVLHRKKYCLFRTHFYQTCLLTFSVVLKTYLCYTEKMMLLHSHFYQNEL